jgi:hypothetical protein
MSENKAGTVLLAASAFVAYLVFSKKKAIGLLNYFISGIAIGSDNNTPVMRVEIGIQNPTNEDFQIRAVVGNLKATSIDGSTYNIGNVSSFVSLSVRPASQVIYPLYVRLNAIAIVSDIVNTIMQGSGPSQVITVEGTVNASGIVAPVTLSYKIL